MQQIMQTVAFMAATLDRFRRPAKPLRQTAGAGVDKGKMICAPRGLGITIRRTGAAMRQSRRISTLNGDGDDGWGLFNEARRMIVNGTIRAYGSYQSLGDDARQRVADHIGFDSHIPEAGNRGDAVVRMKGAQHHMSG